MDHGRKTKCGEEAEIFQGVSSLTAATRGDLQPQFSEGTSAERCLVSGTASPISFNLLFAGF